MNPETILLPLQQLRELSTDLKQLLTNNMDSTKMGCGICKWIMCTDITYKYLILIPDIGIKKLNCSSTSFIVGLFTADLSFCSSLKCKKLDKQGTCITKKLDKQKVTKIRKLDKKGTSESKTISCHQGLTCRIIARKVSSTIATVSLPFSLEK